MLGSSPLSGPLADEIGELIEFAPARPPCVVIALNAERLFSTRFSRDCRAARSLWIVNENGGGGR